MPRKSFPYEAIEIEASPAFPVGYIAYRPCAIVSIGRGDNETNAFISVIDTGADHCLFPSDYLEILGIDRKTLQADTMHGVGTDTFLFATVVLKIAGLGEWLINAAFSDQWKGQHVGFLGYSGFLERITLHLNGEKRVCEMGA